MSRGSTGGCARIGGELVDVIDVQTPELAADARLEAALREEFAIGVCRRGEAPGHLHTELGERADHLPERCVLAADTVDVTHAKLFEGDDVSVHGSSRWSVRRRRTLATAARRVEHCGPVATVSGSPEAVSRRTVFFVSDQTGVTAETLGHSLMTQFEGLEFRPVTLPFVSTLDKAREAVRRIDRAAQEEGQRPIVFSTLVQDELRDVLIGANALFLDLFSAFVGPLERELNTRSTHRAGRAHGIADLAAYTTRINATNFALANDDGSGGDYTHADVVLVGVSRVGKTPTCVYMALQYGVFAANYPLTEEDLEAGRLPARLEPFRAKLYGLTIRAERLQQIRSERRPDSRYASRAQVQYELRAADALFNRYSVPTLDTSESSIEEIASRIMNSTGIERRLPL